jgi:hypothetical protein
MATESHDEIIRLMMEYCKWQDRFEHKGSDEAGVKARNALADIRELTITRRKEIQDKRLQRKKLRNGKPGPPSELIKEAYE